jgi:antibiotic biosynthesis monooxygenase (ABM) superfamily enzyme
MSVEKEGVKPMYVKVYVYHIQPEKEDKYLEIQEKAAKLYQKYIHSHSVHLKSKNHETKWIEISWYKDKEAYDNSINLVNQEKEIQELYASFQSVLDPTNPEIIEEDFLQIAAKNLF